MTAAWERSSCPRCQRASEAARADTDEMPYDLGTQWVVHHKHRVVEGQEHGWTVRWVEEAKVSA